MEKYKILKVTKIEHYLIPMADEDRTEINGWTIAELIKNWFEKRPVNDCHASINTHCVGNASYIKKVTVVDEISLDEDDPLRGRNKWKHLQSY